MSERPSSESEPRSPSEQAEEEGNYEGVSGGEYSGQSGDPNAERELAGDEDDEG